MPPWEGAERDWKRRLDAVGTGKDKTMIGQTIFKIEDMTCGHCEKTVVKALAAVLPGSAVTIDLAARKAFVEGDAVLAEQAIREAGYTPVREV